MFTEYLDGLREYADLSMDECSRVTVWRLTAHDTTDGSIKESPVYEHVYTDLPFRLAGTYRGDSPSRTVSTGDVEVRVAVRIGHFPASTSDLQDDDLIEVTDGENAGAWLRIVEADWQDRATARRVPVIATEDPQLSGPL